MGTALSLGALAWLVGIVGRKRLALVLGLSALLWLCAWSLPAVSIGFRATMEAKYPPTPLQDVPTSQAIVVLGGGVDAADPGHPDPDLRGAADRVWHAARLYHAGKAPLLLLSGGTDPAVNLTSEAEAMRLLLRELGVPDTAMLLEERSRTTEENTRFSAAILRQRGVQTILLVTSALHMKRALAYWQGQGFQVHPAATDYEARPVPAWQLWIPSASALEASARALKEWLGGHRLVQKRPAEHAADVMGVVAPQ